MTRAQEDTEALLQLARERGIHHVIVIVGYENGAYHTAWKGLGLAIRGLIELGREMLIHVQTHQTQPKISTEDWERLAKNQWSTNASTNSGGGGAGG